MNGKNKNSLHSGIYPQLAALPAYPTTASPALALASAPAIATAPSFHAPL